MCLVVVEVAMQINKREIRFIRCFKLQRPGPGDLPWPGTGEVIVFPDRDAINPDFDLGPGGNYLYCACRPLDGSEPWHVVAFNLDTGEENPALTAALNFNLWNSRSPFISEDGLTLYFACDFPLSPGNVGSTDPNYDIWVSRRSSRQDSWSPPRKPAWLNKINDQAVSNTDRMVRAERCSTTRS